MCYENIEHQKLRKIGPYNKFKYPNNNCSVIIRKRQTHTDLMEYLHASCFGPVKSTFIKAIKKRIFLTWPGLSEKLVLKYLHPQTATAKGHIAQSR